MSGNGDKGDWIPVNRDACETLTQILPLNSPDRSVLQRLKSGDRLDVSSRQMNGSVIVEALHNGNVAGTITSTIFQRIAECIEQGYEYVAVVLEINGGACKVKVQSERDRSPCNRSDRLSTVPEFVPDKVGRSRRDLFFGIPESPRTNLRRLRLTHDPHSL